MLISNLQSKHPLIYDQTLRDVAKRFRRRQTAAEERLWEYLRAKRFYQLKFRRQHSLHGFIVDFYCYKYWLVVEVDGPIHNKTYIRDHYRDERLRARGFAILRFTNDQVFYELGHVLNTIYKNCTSPPASGGDRGEV